MPVQKVITYGHPTLKKKAKKVLKIDSNIVRLSEDMIETMHVEDGIGLAAPQINVSLRVIVFDLSTQKIKLSPVVLINPKITSTSGGESEMEEGCLSIPGIRRVVKRHTVVTVEAIDIDGNEVIIKNADGLLAVVLQHEIDHLDGILFTDRIDEEEKLKIKPALKKLSKSNK